MVTHPINQTSAIDANLVLDHPMLDSSWTSKGELETPVRILNSSCTVPDLLSCIEGRLEILQSLEETMLALVYEDQLDDKRAEGLINSSLLLGRDCLVMVRAIAEMLTTQKTNFKQGGDPHE